jgi:hypothetical protein
MNYNKLSERRPNAAPAEKKSPIINDEAWAFTEQPDRDMDNFTESRTKAHDLFNLFTANIIKAKTDFTR